MSGNVLINLVSQQTVPNILPAIDPRLKIHIVILIVSEEMTFQANRLKEIYNLRGISCKIWPIKAPAYDVQAMEDLCLEVIKTLNKQTKKYLNATCGTKIMACTAWRIFERQENTYIIYVDTAQKKLHYLHPRRISSLQLKSYLDIESYLRGYGLELSRQKATWSKGNPIPKISKPARFLGQNAKYLDHFLKVINFAGVNALEKTRRDESWPRSVDVKKIFPKKGIVRDALSLFRSFGLVEENGSNLIFPDQESAYFLSGGWIEEYTFGQACKSQVDEVGLSVEVEWIESANKRIVKNEFDCLIMRNNQLWVVECKTQSFKEKTVEVVYKLDSLKERTAGLFGKGILVSAQKPPEHVLHRAKMNGQIVLGPNDLLHLSSKLKEITS